MQMRALYSKDFNGQKLKEQLPHIFKQADEEEANPNLRAIKRVNFADKYQKMQDETRHKKELEQLQTIVNDFDVYKGNDKETRKLRE